MIRRLTLFLPCVLVLQGCVVFDPVGSFFSQGYRNTVAYFNAYYNASRLFSEAEDEYTKGFRTYQQAVRDGQTAPFRAPQTAVQKFTAVIDKCSNILTFQSESDWVVDALFLIARSYDYMGETVKAERKYSELIAQYPMSEYRIEAVARLGAVLMMQDRRDEALVLLEQADAEARAAGDDDMLPFILEHLAVLHRDAGDYDDAFGYYARLRVISADNEETVSALIDYARLQLELDKPDEALQIARSVNDLTDDEFYLFDGRTLEVHALSALNRLDEALIRIDETLEDFRFLQQQAPIRLLRADVLMKAGKEEEAIDEFTFVDTTFSRRAPGASAAFSLGTYFMSHGEYVRAKDAFERAAGVPGSSVSSDARRRSVSVTRYIGYRGRYQQIDSVVSALRDSLPVLPDPRLDSMETLLSSVMQDMGDWHFADLNAPDSAYIWLTRSVATGSRRPAQARALFILADIASQHPADSVDEPAALYRRIDAEFPESEYAVEARRRLGIVEEASADPGLGLYRNAETALENGKAMAAARMFDSLGYTYPSSTLAMRGLFAAGWVYEYYLADLDSATVRYERVIQSGHEEPFVKEARDRLAAMARLKPTLSAPAAADSAQPVVPPAEMQRDEEGRPIDRQAAPTRDQ